MTTTEVHRRRPVGRTRPLTRAGVAFGALLVACAPARREPPRAPTPAAEWVAERLTFGRSIPGGGSVSDEEWATFLRDVITPRFPRGLTVWRAEGQWLDPRSTLVREPVVVVEIVHEASADVGAALRDIAHEYKRRFHQDAVLGVTAPVSARLYD
ncbi:MAG TPA: DUF3574 domain-containing protein [Longimicrobiales bacterium]|nr:DUF3574 domain-containing protein [Longimicrobiales bacterium]